MNSGFRYFIGFGLLTAASLSLGQVVSLADDNSSATIYAGSSGDPSTGLYGLTNWKTRSDGPNWVAQQLYLVSVNGSTVNSFNNLATPTVTQSSPGLVDIDYALTGGFDFDFRYYLTGSFSNNADIAEIVTFTNRSGAAANISLFEYDQFTPGGVAGGTANLVNTSEIQQFGPQSVVTVGANPIPGRYMIDTVSNVQNAIAAGNLTNSHSTFTNSNLAFAFQWGTTVAADQGWQMSKDKQIQTVPEPTSILALGGLGLLFVRRRRR